MRWPGKTWAGCFDPEVHPHFTLLTRWRLVERWHEWRWHRG